MDHDEILRSAYTRNALNGELGREHGSFINASRSAKLLGDVDVIIWRSGSGTERESGRDDGRNGSFIHGDFCFNIATMLAAA